MMWRTSFRVKRVLSRAGLAVVCIVFGVGCEDATSSEKPKPIGEMPTPIAQPQPTYAHYQEGVPAGGGPVKRRPKRMPTTYAEAARDPDRVSKQRIHYIGQAIRVYQRRNLGAYPQDINALRQAGLVVEEKLFSPRDPKQQMIYFRPAQSAADNRVILYDPVPTDANAYLVYTIGQRTAWLPADSFKMFLDE